MSRWIDAKKRKPTCDNDILILLYGGRMITGCRNAGDWYSLGSTYFGRAHYENIDAEFITHWQPLPKPPKKGRKKP